MFDVASVSGAGGDEEIARLEADIASKRERATASLGELAQRLHHATTLPRWVASHPMAWIGASALLGFIVGASVRRRRGSAW